MRPRPNLARSSNKSFPTVFETNIWWCHSIGPVFQLPCCPKPVFLQLVFLGAGEAASAYKNARGPIRSWNFCNDHYNEHKSDRLGDTVYCLPLNCLLVYNADYWTAVDFFHSFEELEDIHLKVDGNHVLKMFNFLNINIRLFVKESWTCLDFCNCAGCHLCPDPSN